MARLRRALGWLVAVWLIGQFATVVTPALIGVSLDCVCAHGTDATCPMHHRPAAHSRVCAMQSIGTTHDALSAFFSVNGPVPLVPRLIGPQSTARRPLEASLIPLRATASPDPPPPRT